MIEKREILLKVLLVAIDILKEKHLKLGMKATGDWIASLDNSIIRNAGYVTGYDYTKYLVEGRPPSEKLPPIKPIEKWVKAKFGVSGKQGKRIAFAVATKIKNEGTTWHEKGGSDLLEVLKSNESVAIFNKIIGDMLLQQTKLKFEKQLKELSI